MEDQLCPLGPYRYFTTPDGQDVDKKLKFLFKPVAYTAVFLGTADVLLHSKPKTSKATLARYAHLSLPVFGTTLAFVLTSNLLAKTRSKDDKVNWAAGGFTAGGVFGLWRRCQVTFWIAGGALAFVGFMWKYALENDFDVIPKEIDSASSTIDGGSWDWTLTKDNPGAWKKK